MAGSNGIDVSNNNGRLDLSHGFSGLNFVIAKASEGTGYADPDYAYYAEQALAVKAEFGAYHFFHAEALSARAEARAFMAHAKPRPYLGLWVDYETFGASGRADAEAIGLFISTVKLAYPKAKVGIYTNGTGYSRIHPYVSEIPVDAWWFADPNGQVGTPGLVAPNWQIHQYETYQGIDRNYSSWSQAQMREFFSWG